MSLIEGFKSHGSKWALEPVYVYATYDRHSGDVEFGKRYLDCWH